MSHSGSNYRRKTSTTQGLKSCPHGMTKVSYPEVNMLKSSSTLAVSLPINLAIKLGFVSVNGPGETYFVDALCTNLIFSTIRPLNLCNPSNILYVGVFQGSHQIH